MPHGLEKPPLTVLIHYGVLGMKWGVRKERDIANIRSRTIKKGTEIQNISSRQLSSDNARANRLYAAYTSYDKAHYVDTMGNFMYNERGYKNTMLVTKDLNVPSDRHLTETFKSLVKEDPQGVARDMAKAYNAVNMPLIFTRNKGFYDKKFKDLETDKKADKLAKDFLSTVLMTTKVSNLQNNFFAKLIKDGFDAISDVNDRDQLSGTQDPLIIFNMAKLGKTKTVKLSKKELDAYAKYTLSKEHREKKKDVSEIQR